MKYLSTTGNGPLLSFKDAVLSNLPSDGGLFFPSLIPDISEELDDYRGLQLNEAAFKVLSKFCVGDIESEHLEDITKRVFDFPIPLNKITDRIQALELFHGPTFAFKDIGARFLAECLAQFNSSSNKKITVLVATSGDTGGAVANGFLGVDGVDVIILYPKGKVSDLQEKQLTTLGQNITALEVEGTFDDCQSMVKKAFADKELNQRLQLSSANSINIARWLPQSLFYYVPFLNGMEDVTISVPSGNYGNLTSGVLAMKMGVPIRDFIAASNANDVVPRYLTTGEYDPHDTIATIANAMDVADPSNFKRLLSLFETNFDSVIKKLVPYSLDDDGMRESIKACYSESGYLLDPHSAIAYEALKSKDREGVFLGTAHYCKFLPTLEDTLNQKVDTPDFAADLMRREKSSIEMNANYEEFKDFLTS